ncbi:MAG: GvpL/GvpF family gas vesicle protein [bacterium]
MQKYLYCITKDIEPNNLNIAGIEGASVHIIEWQNLLCVASDTDFNDKELDKESALAHEKVLEEVMRHSPIVPIAFGHITKSEDEVKSKLLEAHKDKLEEHLTYFQGKIELSLKAFWLDLNPVFQHIAQTSDEIQRIKARGKITRDEQMRAGEIAAKLLGKKREKTEYDIAEFFKDITIEYKKCNLFGEQMITNLAFLINNNDLSEFDSRVNKYAEKLGDNVKVKYTGPVPPYNFVDLKINLS